MYRTSLCLALTFAATLCMTAQSRIATAADLVGASTNKTTITLKVLTCESCAKKVAAKLSEVSGVGGVKTDVKSKTAIVVPKSSATLSPLQLWEAIEKAGKEPVKLEGPSGTYTSKPKK
ncbi:heavy-metal-associated domain-containing protein [Aporhodopirellula aestuarii]|uniref:Heavy-metal-associated domain-containing protein n=1 Tax=Aporhodopirellula aestuarii TaxID=2950107 RepID=A0ABT0U1F5_9BACT|nr:heavy metal-associated domain-containing protein [Aporhodopirellula aestuarii]MCM2370730.1 heavy-metal-associated domain-containing protein [Aporhodopirellula aestuarii]